MPIRVLRPKLVSGVVLQDAVSSMSFLNSAPTIACDADDGWGTMRLVAMVSCVFVFGFPAACAFFLIRMRRELADSKVCWVYSMVYTDR